jgi:hypothetical protein
MALDAIMIGIMKCNIGGVEAGSVKSASVTIKPQYKEHKTGYPQISDLKALLVAEGICKVDSEESAIVSVTKTIASSLSSGTPAEIKFKGNAPGLGGVACSISGTGFGSGSGLFGKMEDFGYASAETTCIDLTFTGANGAGNIIGIVPFIVPVEASQAMTIDRESLIYGAPTVNGNLCQQAQFSCSAKTRYVMMQFGAGATLDAAIMENTDFSITASFMSGDAASGVQASMVPGNVPTNIAVGMTIPTVGGSSVGINMIGILEADVSFSPGNDWNGISVKYTAILDDPSKIGTNWAGIS